MVLPCEIAAKHIVPAAKAKITRRLKDKGMKQKEIAKILDLTEAAVSQYLSGKRAKNKIPKIKTKRNKQICSICGKCEL